MTAAALSALASLTPDLVTLCERPEPRQGPEPGVVYFDDQDYLRQAGTLLQSLPATELWVFAYGSLLWRPAVQPVEIRAADAPGWRREFCLRISRWRGSPDRPGLMMALRKGGACRGLALRLSPDTALDQLVSLLKREVDTQEDLESITHLQLRTPEGPVRALAFWAEPTTSRMFSETPLQLQAAMIASACGSIGSGAAYLLQTVESLRRHGIEDTYLETLARLVAEEILQREGLAQ